MNAINPKHHVFVFIQNDLGIGGLEVYIYRQMMYLKELGYPLVWVCDKNVYYDKSYKELFADGYVKIWIKKLKYDELREMTSGYNDSRVTFISCYIDGFAQAELFKRKCNWCAVDNFLFVNHYTGWMNYLETAYPMPIKSLVKRVLSPAFKSMIENDNVRYFALNHIDAVYEHYSCKPSGEKTDYKVPQIVENDKFDEDRIKKLYHQDEFVIIAASRFDFPHKGFFIGLLKSFCKLKEKHSNISLRLVGSGRGEELIKKTISEFPEDVQKSITLCGSLSPDELKESMKKANLNISAAGCCSLGAKVGTLSLPARNYSMDCETYGFYPEAGTKTTCTEPGEEITPYIEKVLAMSEEEYIAHCRYCYNFFAEKRDFYANITNITNKSSSTLNYHKCKLIRFIYKGVMLRTRARSVKRKIKKKLHIGNNK